ncbi:oxidoreductase [Chryseobacterium paridis]|uniref:SDR family NAD(P)-dependent oxidoreductase n=1 Tax=Chryseobacterium paridis TaxID=2800328 RepID=A0ABS1FW69_9FLAO|nr:oxidoreductase [Chryseobacterium paridis]MBK1896654.1 SDR family NAD(P)-dependent oxidoreductase [Chryseobacterium paridis]
MENKQKVWLVTGVSGGLGKALASAVYHSGDIIIGSVRKEEDKIAFEQAFPDRSKVFMLDVSDSTGVESMVDQVINEYGRIDVLVNNAGYGLFGLVEEVDEIELRKQLDINLVAVWKMTQTVLPYMRKQKAGHIIQISSRVGILAGTGNGAYTATKFAIEGMSEALAAEVAPFGIKVTLTEPGPLRTDFFGRSVMFSKNEIEDYKESLGDLREKYKSVNGNQPGDPAKVAEAIIQIAALENPPFRLPFTASTIDALQQKINEYQKVITDWKELALSIEF